MVCIHRSVGKVLYGQPEAELPNTTNMHLLLNMCAVAACKSTCGLASFPRTLFGAASALDHAGWAQYITSKVLIRTVSVLKGVLNEQVNPTHRMHRIMQAPCMPCLHQIAPTYDIVRSRSICKHV